MSVPSKDITQLLVEWGHGRQEAQDALMPLVYDELRRLAGRYLRRERPGHTLQTDALVHEAYVRLVDQTQVQWQNRAHFFGLAATAMRRILVEHARARQAEKRGGGVPRLAFNDALPGSSARGTDLIALDEALSRLAQLDLRKSRLVELRFFAGLSLEEAADALAISRATVKREWNSAKAWLYREIKGHTL